MTALTSDIDYVVTGHQDGSICIRRWDLFKKIHVRTESGVSITGLCIVIVPSDDANGTTRHLISVNDLGEFKKFNMADGRCLGASGALYDSTASKLISIPPPTGYLSDPLANQYVLCAGTSTEITIINICSLELATVWGGHDEWVIPGHINGKLLTIHADGQVSLWDFDHTTQAISRVHMDYGKLAISSRIVSVINNEKDVFAATKKGVIGFTFKDDSIIPLFSIQQRNTEGMFYDDGQLYIWETLGQIQRYTLTNANADARGKDDIEHFGYRPDLVQTIPPPADCHPLISMNKVNGNIQAVYFTHGQACGYCVFNGDGSKWMQVSEQNNASVTASTMISDKLILLRKSNGDIDVTNVAALLTAAPPSQTLRSNTASISYITAVSSSHFMSGDVDGTVRFFETSSFQNVSRHAVHCAPVIGVLGPIPDAGENLSSIFFTIGSDASLAAFSEDLQSIFVLPGSRVALEGAFYRGSEDSLVLWYGDGSIRYWKIDTMQLDRQLSGQAAQDLLSEFGWRRVTIKTEQKIGGSQTMAMAGAVLSTNIKHLLHTVNYGHFHEEEEELDEETDAPRSSKDLWSAAESRVDFSSIKAILSCMMTWGLDAALDKMCIEDLGISKSSKLSLGFKSAGGVTSLILPSKDSQSIWTISPTVSAHLLLCITALVRSLLSVRGMERHASNLMTFYSAELPSRIENFCKPSLSYLVKFWQDTVMDVQQASRMLISATVNNLTSTEMYSIVKYWRNFLPAVSPPDLYASQYMARSAIILGIMGSDKPDALPPDILRETALSLTLLLNDESKTSHRLVAIELCGRGFVTWQQHFNAAEVLRTLFQFATSKMSPLVRQYARSAIIQVASLNTPLFISTIVSDIMNDRDPEARNGCMKIITLIVRKKPLIFYANLPRLVEAVVKSLDPNVSYLRETVMQTASAILHNLVNIYPSIDFNSKTQRLVVGTHEGAVIVYDLRTATRLLIFEGHTKPVSAVTFSPDAKYVVSVAIDENRVLVWRLQTGILGMFSGGIGQSNHPQTPLKHFDFNLGDEANLTIASMLEWIKFEWPSDRSVRLKIRETTLTFPV